MYVMQDALANIIGETLVFIELGELRVSRFPQGNGEVRRLIADLQEGVFESCDECGIGLFFSFGMWDRLGYEHFNNGAFYCRECDDKLYQEEFGDTDDDWYRGTNEFARQAELNSQFPSF